MNEKPPFHLRTGIAGRVASYILALAVAAQSPVLAVDTDRLTQTELGGFLLPEVSRAWNSDPDESKAATLDLAAALVARTCVDREYHIWRAESKELEQIQDKVDAAFPEAGWTFTTISQLDGGHRIHSARRSRDHLILNWLPQDRAIALLICRVDSVPRVQLDVALGSEPTPNVPLPRQRPPRRGGVAGAAQFQLVEMLADIRMFSRLEPPPVPDAVPVWLTAVAEPSAADFDLLLKGFKPREQMQDTAPHFRAVSQGADASNQPAVHQTAKDRLE